LVTIANFTAPFPNELIDIYNIDKDDYVFGNIKLKDIDIVLGYSQSMAPFVSEYKKHHKIKGYCVFFDFPVGIVDGKDTDNYDFNYSQKFYYWVNCALELDGVIFHNQYFADQFFKRYKRIPYVVHHPAFFSVEDFFGDKTKEYIVGSSSVFKYKGIHLLISALSSLPYDYIHIYRNVDPPYLDSIRVSCEVQDNSFKFYKNLSSKKRSEYIYNASMLVYPQIIEWLGVGSIVDALSLKTPVICYDYPIAKELFKDKVLYAKKGSINDLRKKIKLLYEDSDLYEKLAEDGYNLYRKEYTVEKMIDRLLGVFNE